MQCPRCGLQNAPQVSACARCGLPVGLAPPSRTPPAGQPPQLFPGQPAYPPPGQPAYPPPGQPAYPPPGQPAYPPPAVQRSDGTTALRLALALAALLSLAYAVWALTARRGIFAGFQDGDPADVGDAVSSDHLDTGLLVVAGAIALAALAWWIVSVATRRSSRSGATVAAMALCLLGTAVTLAGLILSAGVPGGVDVADQGAKGVTAAVVLGGGFLMLTIGLGLASLTAGRPLPPNPPWPRAQGPASW